MTTDREVLAELVRIFDLETSAYLESEAFNNMTPKTTEMFNEVTRLKPLAWAAARARLALPEAVPARPSKDDLTECAGYRLVPLEPTKVMVRAGEAAYWAAQPAPGQIRYADNDVEVVYKAMITAAASKDDLIEARGNDAHPRPGVFLIKFDDTEVGPEIVIGEAAARERFRRVSTNWNAHLFVKVASNTRDDPYYSDNAMTPPPDWRNLLMLIRPYVEDAGTRGYDGTGGHDMRETANKRLAAIDAALAAPQIEASGNERKELADKAKDWAIRVEREARHAGLRGDRSSKFGHSLDQCLAAIDALAAPQINAPALPVAWQARNVLPDGTPDYRARMDQWKDCAQDEYELWKNEPGIAVRALYAHPLEAPQINALAGTPALPSREVTGSPGAPIQAEPVAELRAVYEAARRVLRFDGVDHAWAASAMHELDDAIEVVKNIDAGYGDDIEG